MKNYTIAVAGTGYVGLSLAKIISGSLLIRRMQEACSKTKKCIRVTIRPIEV